MRRYLRRKKDGDIRVETETREPLKVLQILAGHDTENDDMSASRKCGLTRTFVPRDNRVTRSPDRRRNVPSSTDLNKSGVSDRISSSSKISRPGSSSPSGKRQNEKSTSNVQSLTSSPKWSRIKDKFENGKTIGEGDSKSKRLSSVQKLSSDHLRTKLLISSKREVSTFSKTDSVAKSTHNREKLIPENQSLVKSAVKDQKVPKTSAVKDGPTSVKVTSNVRSYKSNNLQSTLRSNSVPDDSASPRSTNVQPRPLSEISGPYSKNVYTRKPYSSSRFSYNDESDVLSSLPRYSNSTSAGSTLSHISNVSGSKCSEQSKSNTTRNLDGNASNIVSQTTTKYLRNKEVEKYSKLNDTSALNLKLVAVHKPASSNQRQISASNNQWVKDNSGNWVKHADTKKSSHKQVSTRVAILRNKFTSPESSIGTSHSENVLAKSKSAANVPNVTALPRELAKSSTTSNILSSSHSDEAALDGADALKEISNVPRASVSSSDSMSSNGSEKSSLCSADRDGKLSLVQRAVQSYEDSLSSLSPETQKKLKLLGEKFRRIQNDEDWLMESSPKNKISNGSCQNNAKNDNSNPVKNMSSDSEQLVQPTRNFLSRYQNHKTRNDVKVTNVAIEDPVTLPSSKIGTESKGSNIEVELNNSALDTDSTSNCKISVKDLAKQFVAQNPDDSSSNNGKTTGKGLRPNASFLWRNGRMSYPKSDVQEPVEDSETSQNYYVLENYYCDPENSSSRSQMQNGGNPSLKLTAGEVCYQNIEPNPSGILDGDEDGWLDLSDDDGTTKSAFRRSNHFSKRRRSKRYSQLSSVQNLTKPLNTDSIKSDEINDLDKDNLENDLESNYSDHLYEPVYETLGSLVSDENNENGELFISPDDEQTRGLYSSCTSLESLHSEKGTTEEIETKKNKKKKSRNPENSPGISKKATSRIRQLRRHLSWSKSDIKLELSSKFNKIKIKKNGHHGTEIGVRVQENDSASTSPKKNTFIKCILKHKGTPEKKSPSPKKESAHFYVHLSMKQRPYSESCMESRSESAEGQSNQDARKTWDISQSNVPNPLEKPRRRSSSQIIQRPKTPPPLPPTKTGPKRKDKDSIPEDSSVVSGADAEKENCIYSECSAKNASLDSTYGSSRSFLHSSRGEIATSGAYTIGSTDSDSKNTNALYATIDSFRRKRSSVASSASYDSYAMADESGSSGASSSTTYSSGFTLHIESEMMPFYSGKTGSLTSNLSLPLMKDYKSEFLKSPFEEEPLYQFYHKDVQQRASMWYNCEGSESDFDDNASEKVIANSLAAPPKPPRLQTQTSAMDLLQGEGGQRSLWGEVPEVRNSGILDSMSAQDRKIQEAMFEVITSEASYLKSLNFLLEHFVNSPEIRGGSSQEKPILDKRELHVLFSDVPPVRDVSVSFLSDLEKRWLENIVISNVCDIIYHHASKYFSVYVKYCSNQLYQERTLKQLKESRPQFVEVLKKLESNPVCQGLDMHSFLMLPMQRITRLPLLVDAIFHRLDVDSPNYESCKMALARLNKIVAECNEGARKMERMEEMLVISHQIDFRDCKGLGLLSASRWLVKRGELVQLVSDSVGNKRTFGRNQRWGKVRLFLFLFTDLLVITKRKNDGSYSVVDYCPRNMVQVMLLDENVQNAPPRLPSGYQNVFQMIMLSNKEGKTVEMILSCVLESDRTRWMNAVTPPKSENPEEKIYEEWDCPQVQCTHNYVAQQPDELSIEETEVVNVFRKMPDGWFEGERIRDGVRGWFPSSHAVEIVSSHMRARNLRQRYRLLMLSQTYLEQQQLKSGQSNKSK